MGNSTAQKSRSETIRKLIDNAKRRALSLTTADKIDCPQSSKEPKNED